MHTQTNREVGHATTFFGFCISGIIQIRLANWKINYGKDISEWKEVTISMQRS